MTNSFEIFSPYIEVLVLLSLPTFLTSLIIIPWIICKLPSDYFADNTVKSGGWTEHPFAVTLCFYVIQNIIGVIFFIAGFILLFLPGQGILSMLLGISLMTFPGKKTLLNRLTRRQTVRKSLNWIRKNSGKKRFSWGNP